MALFSQQQPSFSTFAKATGGRYDPTTPSGQSSLRRDILNEAQRAEAFRNAASAVQEQKALQGVQAETARPSQEVAPGMRAIIKNGKVVGYSQPLESTGPSKVGGLTQPFEKGFLAALQKASPSKPSAKPAEQVTETVTEKVTEKPVAAQAPVEKPAAPTPKPMSFAEAAKQVVRQAQSAPREAAAREAGATMQQLQAKLASAQDPEQVDQIIEDYAAAEAQQALNTMTDEQLNEFIQPALIPSERGLAPSVRGEGFFGGIGANLEKERLSILDAFRNAKSGLGTMLFGGTPKPPSREAMEYLAKIAAKTRILQQLGR